MLARDTGPIARRRLAWLLWFGVLLALAQAAASAHAISHIGQDVGRSRDSSLVHAQCDLCLLGATIGGAAPAADAPASLGPALGHALVARVAAAAPASAPALAYRSRAPPTAPR